MPELIELVHKPLSRLRPASWEEILLKGAFAVGVGSLALLIGFSGRTTTDQGRDQQRQLQKDMRRSVELLHDH